MWIDSVNLKWNGTWAGKYKKTFFCPDIRCKIQREFRFCSDILFLMICIPSGVGLSGKIIKFLCRSQWSCGLRRGSWPVGCWDRGFESRSRHGCLSLVFLCCVFLCRYRPCDELITRPRSPTVCLIFFKKPSICEATKVLKDCRATEKRSTFLWVSPRQMKLQQFNVLFFSFLCLQAIYYNTSLSL
jgi:hypothetical protein